MVVIKRTNRKGSKPPWAKGSRAIAIDQRSGFKELQEEMVFEPGTEYFIHKSESDRGSNLVTDPLNYASPKMLSSEAIGLKYPSPDVALSVGIIVSSGGLALGPIEPNVNFVEYPGTSVTTEET